MKLFKVTLLSLATFCLLSNTANATCYNYSSWGTIHLPPGRTPTTVTSNDWLFVSGLDWDKYPPYVNNFIYIYLGGYTSYSRKLKGSKPFKLNRGTYSFFVEDFSTCGSTGDYKWFGNVRVK